MISTLATATLVVILCDVFLGFAKAWALCIFESKKARRGAVEHFAICVVLLISEYFSNKFGYQIVLDSLEMFLIFSYGTSIIKNLKRLGVPIPVSLEKKLDAELNKHKDSTVKGEENEQ
ncbi:phage holin family protein [Pseudolactococcus reticulitermitis]|uniref:Holin n=1 Tax=Pseudolactococcus reticulitermitis TaxID=2025039 RepID=A0A224WWS4_9LACT|nr:phage holin family protein [Lactococcus reticulitermitis]GAX46758.1 hypothetical protein RsY01_337 [Lactococcus reticulitermitis]